MPYYHLPASVSRFKFNLRLNFHHDFKLLITQARLHYYINYTDGMPVRGSKVMPIYDSWLTLFISIMMKGEDASDSVLSSNDDHTTC